MKEKEVDKILKIVIVGDGMTGKSCICKGIANKEVFKRTYQPTISETHEVFILIGKKNYHVILWDSAGVEEWEHLRSQDYYDADCFLCCYSIDNRTSFDNIESKWIPELKRYCPSIPIIIVGTKKDLRTPSNSLISEDEGKRLMRVVKAQSFIECSSKSLSSLDALLILGVSTILNWKNSKGQCIRKFSCHIL